MACTRLSCLDGFQSYQLGRNPKVSVGTFIHHWARRLSEFSGRYGQWFCRQLLAERGLGQLAISQTLYAFNAGAIPDMPIKLVLWVLVSFELF